MVRLPDRSGAARMRDVRELRGLNTRMSVINWSIGLCVATGLVVCVMVAMLFIQGGGSGAFETPIAVSFILAMAFLLIALALFLAEVRLAIRSLHVPAEILAFEAEDEVLSAEASGGSPFLAGETPS